MSSNCDNDVSKATKVNPSEIDRLSCAVAKRTVKSDNDAAVATTATTITTTANAYFREDTNMRFLVNESETVFPVFLRLIL